MGKTCVDLTAKQTSTTMQPVILVTFTRKFSIVKQFIHLSLNYTWVVIFKAYFGYCWVEVS